MKDHSTGAQVVAGQIFINSEEPESHTEDGESFRNQEEKERTLGDLNSLELSALLNKDLEGAEVQKLGNFRCNILSMSAEVLESVSRS